MTAAPTSPATPSLPPWLLSPWSALQGARRANRFPHALLLTGPLGVGKRLLVEALARSLLCPRTDARGFACGQCPDCLLLAAGTHPDLVRVGPDEETKSGEIRVDAIRALAGTEGLTAHRGGWKLILIDPAHRMNVSAANALLKTLEEPAPSTLMCLVSEQPSRLTATIRSRCQALHLALPVEAEALAWLTPQVRGLNATTLLHLAHGAPLRALELADKERLAVREKLFAGFVAVAQGQRDPLAEAAAWNEADPALLLDWLSGWLSDLLRLAGARGPAPAEIPAKMPAKVPPEMPARVPAEVQANWHEAASHTPDNEKYSRDFHAKVPAKVSSEVPAAAVGARQAPATTTPRLINSDKRAALTTLAARVAPAPGYRLLRRIWQAGGGDTSNLNRLLLYETWLLDWARLTSAPPPAVSVGRPPSSSSPVSASRLSSSQAR